MKRGIFKSISVAFLSAAMFAVTACNTKIEVKYDYDIDEYVELGDYKSITVEIDKTSIENEYIEKKILEDQKTNTKYVASDKESADTDKITFDFKGMISGIEIAALSGEDYSMILGEDEFDLDVQDVKDALYGMTAGKTSVITTQLPEDYSDLSYAGERVVFEITMKEVGQANVPMITDTYCKEYFNCDTVDDYKEYVKNEVQSEIDSAYDEARREAILTKLADICKVKDYPESLIEEKTEELGTSIGFYATWANMSKDEYCNFRFQMTFDEFVKKSAAQQMILEAICKAENLCVTEYEYKGDLEKFANDNGFSNKDSFVEKYGKDKVVKGMLIQKAQDIVMDSATVNDK
ncbi:MAG: FKBP-type peptidyl-prolyl cis-trans isomerase [Lachnospira sp.]